MCHQIIQANSLPSSSKKLILLVSPVVVEKNCQNSESNCKLTQMGKTKASYLICHGLAPYFKYRLLNVLRKTRFIVTSFDESFNKVISKGQMDVLVRFWNTAEFGILPY